MSVASLILAFPYSSNAQEPKLARDFVRGMTFAHIHSREYGYGSERAREELVKLKADGVEWIAISRFAYQRKVDEPLLYYGPGDPTMLDRDMVKVTEDAHALGLKVFSKPHIWSNQFWGDGKWNGDIEMKTDADTDLWWERYTGYIVAEAELAAEAKMDALSIGHEYIRMTLPRHTKRWRALIAAVRAKYSGPLVYGAHHTNEAEQIEFWDALDVVGVNAYFPLGGETADDIAAAWKPHLEKLAAIAKRTNRSVVFTEIGFPAHRGALTEPWKADGSRPIDEGLQARAYEGTFRAIAGAPFIHGTFWWKWFSGGRDNPHEREPFDPSGRAAEQVLRRWYKDQ